MDDQRIRVSITGGQWFLGFWLFWIAFWLADIAWALEKITKRLPILGAK